MLPKHGRSPFAAKCKRAFLRLHTSWFEGQPLPRSCIARLLWDLQPQAGILFGVHELSMVEGAEVSTTQLLLEFPRPVHVAQFAEALRQHMAPFLARVESRQDGRGEWGLESVVCCPIRSEEQWVAYMFYLSAPGDEAPPHALGSLHYQEETLRLHISRPCCQAGALPVPVWRGQGKKICVVLHRATDAEDCSNHL